MTVAAMKATAIVMATGNASLPPSRDLSTTITTTTANNHRRVTLRWGQGAVGVVNDGDKVGPGGFEEEDTLVLTADSAPALIGDDTNGGDGGITIFGSAFEDAVARAGIFFSPTNFISIYLTCYETTFIRLPSRDMNILLFYLIPKQVVVLFPNIVVCMR
jgi:hypothetical protein